MRNAPKFNLDAVARATEKAKGSQVAAPAVNALRSRVGGMTGNQITLAVCGRDVNFSLKVVPAERVEKATLVWGENERVQELLTESALDDLIPSFLTSGQQVPAFGRDVSGVIEVADGSRRRKTAIHTGCDYRVLVGDLDEEQMRWLSQVGNDYRQTSAYERGRRYARLMKDKYSGLISPLAEAESISRKVIMRCVNTAKLPLEIIKVFANPTELSARAGDGLSRTYEKHGEEMLAKAAELLERKSFGEDIGTDGIIKELEAVGSEKEKTEIKVRKFGTGITAKYKGENVAFELKGATPGLIKRIEVLLENHDKQVSEEIEEMFERIEARSAKK